MAVGLAPAMQPWRLMDDRLLFRCGLTLLPCPLQFAGSPAGPVVKTQQPRSLPPPPPLSERLAARPRPRKSFAIEWNSSVSLAVLQNVCWQGCTGAAAAAAHPLPTACLRPQPWSTRHHAFRDRVEPAPQGVRQGLPPLPRVLQPGRPDPQVRHEHLPPVLPRVSAPPCCTCFALSAMLDG